MAEPLHVAVLADTHVAAGRTLPDDVWALLRQADVILHAGDVTATALLDELRAVAPSCSATTTTCSSAPCPSA